MTSKTRTITLTNQPPVRINEDNWPVIAVGKHYSFDGQYDFQANRKITASIRVRQHADGRFIVYAVYEYETRWQGEQDETLKAGRLFTPQDDLVAAIRVVGDDLGNTGVNPGIIDELVRDCIADLPPVDLD